MDRTRGVTLVWQLAHSTLVSTMECVARRRDDGQVEVSIDCGPVQEAFGVFPDTTAAIRAVFRFEAQMLERGWRKIV